MVILLIEKFEQAHEIIVFITQATSEDSGEPARIARAFAVHMKYGSRQRVHQKHTSSPSGWLHMRI